MTSITHREYRTWRRWLQEEWNHPSRADYYLMQIAQRVQQVLLKNPRQVTTDHQKIEFKFTAKPAKTSGETMQQAKSRWKLWTGFGK